MSLPAIEIRDADDPRLADYRRLKERHLNAEGGRFVAESERVVRRLVASGLGVHSVLLTPPRLATLADALAGPFPVFLAAQPVLDAIAGFHVHRGCLAIGERPAAGAAAARRARAGRGRGPHRRRQPGGAGAPRRRVRRGRAGALPALRRSVLPQGDPRLARGGVQPAHRSRARVARRSRRRCAATGSRSSGPSSSRARRRWPHFRPPARFALLLGAEGPGSVRGGARLLRPPRHHPDVGGRRLAQRRDGRRDFSVRADAGAAAAGASLRRVQLTNSLRVSR